MRPYRAKRVDNGEWVKGSLVGDSFIVGYFEIREFLGSEDLMRCACVVHEVIPSTVGQSTGFKDKNKKESYFGDLIKMWGTDVFEIRWDRIMGRVFLHNLNKKGDSLYLYASDIQNGEIISNVHDSELLETPA